jgi:hypothetical protein
MGECEWIWGCRRWGKANEKESFWQVTEVWRKVQATQNEIATGFDLACCFVAKRIEPVNIQAKCQVPTC